MKRPNVLFILSDQHNAKVLGHKGHPDARTPNLDRMAAEGVRFENAITQNPICTPSRGSWLSGQYCHNHGYYGLSGPGPGGLPTVLGQYRLVYYPPEMFADEYPEGFGELYDLEADPWEMRNLYFEPEAREIARDMERELIRWLITTTRPVTVHPDGPWEGSQGVTRYGHTVNRDGKIHPDRIRPYAGGNYT